MPGRLSSLSRRPSWSCILPHSPPWLLDQITEHPAERLNFDLAAPALGLILWACAVCLDCVILLHTAPDSSWDCRRVLHKTPPNELDRHSPCGRGLHPSQCTRLNCEVPCIVLLCVLLTLNSASTPMRHSLNRLRPVSDVNLSSCTRYEVVLGNVLQCLLLGMSLSLFQHGRFTSEVTIAPGAIPDTAVLAHKLRTSLKAAISCLALQNIAGVSPSSNNKTCPLPHSLALNMKANFFPSWKLLRWLHNFRSLWIEPSKVCRATFLLT